MPTLEQQYMPSSSAAGSRPHFWLLALLIIATVTASGSSSDYFVSSTKGDDTSGDGSAAHPFATIQKAQQAVRTHLASSPALAGNVTVNIDVGKYYVPAGLNFSSLDSG